MTPEGPQGVSLTAVTGLIISALLIGLLAGFVMFSEDPNAALIEARRNLQAQDRLIAQLTNQVESLQAELNQGSPGAAELLQREAALAQREQALIEREAAVAARERNLEGRWTLPRIDLPSGQDVVTFFNRLSGWVARTVNADESLEDATSQATPAVP
jgi:hypothetical protein